MQLVVFEKVIVLTVRLRDIQVSKLVTINDDGVKVAAQHVHIFLSYQVAVLKRDTTDSPKTHG